MEKKQSKYLLDRRTFLRRATLAAGAASLPFPYVGRVLGANDRINVACIGVGGKGSSDSSHAFEAGGNIVGICDVDANTLEGRDKRFKEAATKASRTYDAKRFKDWRKMLEELGSIIARHIGKSGPGLFVLPGMFKVSTRKKPAVKAGPRKHPITGEMIMGKAKPASVSVRVRALKKLKDMAN